MGPLNYARAEIFTEVGEANIMMIHDVKNDSILQDYSQEPSLSSTYEFRGRGVLDTPIIMLESYNLAHKLRVTFTYLMIDDVKDDLIHQ